MRTIAIVLIILGAIMTIFTGFNLITEKEVLDIGAIEINKKESTPIYWSPITGVVILGIGLVMLFVGKKK